MGIALTVLHKQCIQQPFFYNDYTRQSRPTQPCILAYTVHAQLHHYTVTRYNKIQPLTTTTVRRTTWCVGLPVAVMPSSVRLDDPAGCSFYKVSRPKYLDNPSLDGPMNMWHRYAENCTDQDMHRHRYSRRCRLALVRKGSNDCTDVSAQVEGLLVALAAGEMPRHRADGCDCPSALWRHLLHTAECAKGASALELVKNGSGLQVG